MGNGDCITRGREKVLKVMGIKLGTKPTKVQRSRELVLSDDGRLKWLAMVGGVFCPLKCKEPYWYRPISLYKEYLNRSLCKTNKPLFYERKSEKKKHLFDRMLIPNIHLE